MKTAGIIVFVILLIAVSGIFFLIYKAKEAMRKTSRIVFGTDSFRDGLEKQADMLSEIPKSVSGMTSIYLPQIIKDFPEFNWDEFRQKGEIVLLSALSAITAQDSNLLKNTSRDLKNQVDQKILEDREKGITTYYDCEKIHTTQITKYNKYQGKCTLVMQSAVEYLNYAKQNGSIVSGSAERKIQTKYNITLVYVQDEEIVKKYEGDQTVTGLKCPNCGAGITNLGAKKCEYCGSTVREINIYAWKFNHFDEVETNRVL